jgi:uncharacterized protein
MKTFLASFLLILAAAAGISPCHAQISERHLIVPVAGGTLTPEQVRAAAPAYALTSYDIPTPDGARLHAVLLRQPRARGTLLYFGGNGFTMERFGAPTAAVFQRLGLNLMLVDHRGYGLSTGTPTLALIEADGLTAFDYLRRLRGVNRARIIVHGQSLGSFIAGHVGAHRDTAAIVLESSVTTAEEWVAARVGAEQARLITIDPALRGRGNTGNVRAIAEPLLLIVGADDRVTPSALTQALYAASPLPDSRRFLVIVPGAGHNDAMLHPEAIAAYERLLDAALGAVTRR